MGDRYVRLEESTHKEPEATVVGTEKQMIAQLLHSNSALLDGKSQEEVFKSLLQSIQAGGFDRARIYLLSDDEQYMHLKAHVGIDEQYLKRSLSVNTDWSLRMLLSSTCAYKLPHRNDLLEPFIESQYVDEVDEWACAPLLVKGRVIGKLSVDNKVSHRRICQQDLDYLMFLASQV